MCPNHCSTRQHYKYNTARYKPGRSLVSYCTKTRSVKALSHYRHNSAIFCKAAMKPCVLWKADPFDLILTLLQFSKSFKAAWGTRRRTAVLTSLRFRRGRATASPSRICPVTWSSPQTARAARSWRPTQCLEDATRSVRCWRRPDSASCLRSPSGKDMFSSGWGLRV